MILDPIAPVALFLFCVACFLTGHFFIRRFLAFVDPFFGGMISIALGYGVIAYFLVFLGVMGHLTWLPVSLFFLCVFLFGARHIREFLRWFSSLFSYMFKKGGGSGLRFLQILFAAVAGATLLFCFLPEIAHDSLVYHLNLPKLYVQTASMRIQEYDLMTYRPMLLECLYSLAFLFKCLPLAKLIHWLTGFLLVMGLMKMIEDETRSYATALFLGLMLLVTPMFINEIQTTYTDVGAAFFVFLSFVLFLYGMEKTQRALYFFSGLLMGLAVSTKLLAAITAAGMVVAYVCCEASGASRPRLRFSKAYFMPLVIFAAGFFLGFGYWSVRNAVFTGNPFYPYFSGLFGLPNAALEQEFIQGGIPKTVINFLLLPFLIQFRPDVFDRHHFIGPFFLIAFVLMLFAIRRSFRVRFTTVTVLCVLAIWFFLCQNYRYLLPVMPLLIYASAVGYSCLKENQSRAGKLAQKLVIAGGLASLFISLLIGGYHFRGHLKAVFYGWSPSRYLSAMEPSVDIADWINRHLPVSSKILSVGDIRAFYFDRSFVGVDVYAIRHPEALKISESENLRHLRERGFTHLLIRFTARGKEISSNPLDAAYWAPLVNVKNGLPKVFHLESRNIRGDKFVYELFQLD